MASLRHYCDQRQTGFFSDEEVEFPVFHDDGGFVSHPRVASLCNSDEEIISDNEVQRKNIELWLAANRFIFLNYG